MGKIKKMENINLEHRLKQLKNKHTININDTVYTLDGTYKFMSMKVIDITPNGEYIVKPSSHHASIRIAKEKIWHFKDITQIIFSEIIDL